MKKIHLFSVLLILNMWGTNAQSTYDIKINFENKIIEKFPVFKEGDYYRIIISDINLNLWKISLNTKDTTLFTALRTPTFDGFSLETLSSLVANLKNSTSSSPVFKNDLINLHSLENLNFPKLKGNENIISDRLNEEKLILISLLENQIEIVNKIDNLKFEIGKKQLSAYSDNNLLESNYDIELAIKEIDQIRIGIEEFSKLVTSHKSNFESFSKKNADDINKKVEFIEADKERKESYSKFISFLSTLKESINSEKSLELLKSILFIRNKKGSYTSLPLQFKEDQANVELFIEPLSSDFRLQAYKMPFVFPIRSNSYWSIGVSFYGSNLYDERYSTFSTSTSDTTRVYNLIKEKDEKVEIGMATLVRFGKKFNNDTMGVHGTFGPGISIGEKIKPRILVGGGFSIGKKHNVSVDVGGIAGYVDRISNVYDISTGYAELPTDITISKVKFGIFFALGYLFTL